MEPPAEAKTFCARCGRFHPATLASCPRCPPSDDGNRGNHCPRCDVGLASLVKNGVTIDSCARCRGLWFDGGELERALDVTTKGKTAEEVEELRDDLPRRASPIERGSLACVRCREAMERRQIVPKMGVVVDVCPTHGIWFDGGEWEQFGALVRAGALEVLRQDKALTRPKRPRGWRDTPAGHSYAAERRGRLFHVNDDPYIYLDVFDSLWP